MLVIPDISTDRLLSYTWKKPQNRKNPWGGALLSPTWQQTVAVQTTSLGKPPTASQVSTSPAEGQNISSPRPSFPKGQPAQATSPGGSALTHSRQSGTGSGTHFPGSCRPPSLFLLLHLPLHSHPTSPFHFPSLLSSPSISFQPSPSSLHFPIQLS